MNDVCFSLHLCIFRSWITSMTSWSLCSWSSHIFAWDEGSLTWWKTRPWLTRWRGLVSEAVAARPALMEVAVFKGLSSLMAALGGGWDWVRDVCPPTPLKGWYEHRWSVRSLIIQPFMCASDDTDLNEKKKKTTLEAGKCSCSLKLIPDATNQFVKSPGKASHSCTN